jgi:predicted nucleic acid-binding protein
LANSPESVVVDSSVLLALILPDTPRRQSYAMALVDAAVSLDTVVESFTGGELFALASKFGCQSNDAIYLQLAQELGASVATLDDGMLQGARPQAASLHGGG